MNPLSSGPKKPVLVWIYGGRFLVGTASTKVYSPAYMMDHDIVMVSIQYRVGPYGFLSSGDESAPGNYGLLDQVLALKWIQQNIALFGGDPNSVTVSGHSAGSASAHMHMLSPLSKGLVHKVISLSGTGVNYWANRNTQHGFYARKLAEIMECPTDNSEEMIQCLRRAHPIKLTQAQWKLHDYFHKNPAKLPLSTFLPRVDKESESPFMPETGIDLIKSGKFEKLPWMVGLTSQEGAWYVSTLYGQNNMTYLKEFDEKLEDVIQALITEHLLGTDVSPKGRKRCTCTFSKYVTFRIFQNMIKALKFYTNGEPLADINQRVPMAEFSSDLIFNTETLLALHLQCRKSQAPIYFYQFNYRGKWSFAHEFEETPHDYEGVAHLDDIRFYMK